MQGVVRAPVLLKGLKHFEKKGHLVNFSLEKRTPNGIFIYKIVHILTDLHGQLIVKNNKSKVNK
jgi:hypothetical protein